MSQGGTVIRVLNWSEQGAAFKSSLSRKAYWIILGQSLCLKLYKDTVRIKSWREK